MLHELIKLIHVNIDQQLRGQVAERQADAGNAGVEAPDNDGEQPNDVLIGNALRHCLQKNRLIDIRKKLLDVALEHPDSLRIVFRNGIGKFFESVQGAMRPLPVLA